MDTTPPLSEQRVREIVREEIEWALKITTPAPAISSPRVLPVLTPAAERRAQRFLAIAEAFKAGASAADCAARHGVCVETVRRALIMHGVDPMASKVARHRPMADDYEAGLTLTEVAAKHNCSQVTVRRALRVCGVKPRGAYEKKSKKNDPRLARMTEMRTNGATLEEIGAEFRITRERVRQLLHRAGVSTTAGERPITPEQRAAVEEYIAEHGNLHFYAAKLGVSVTAFRSWVLKCGHAPHDKGNKLTPLVKARAERVGQLYLEGVAVEEIAKQVGFKHATAVYLDLARVGIKPERLRELGKAA